MPQEPRQATAATQPFPIGDAFVPLSMEVAPEGFELVNRGGIFTPYLDGLRLGEAGPARRRELAAELSRHRNRLHLCLRGRRRERISGLGNHATQLPPAGEFYIGGNFGTNPMPLFGVFAALDLQTNKLVWQQHWPERCLSGSVTTAGGLVFVGRNDGRLTALDSATGAKRWEFQTGAGVNAPASVFEHGGRQYVAVYSGGHVQGGPRGDSVWLFSLNGTLDEVAPAAQQSMTRAPSNVNAEVSLESGQGRLRQFLRLLPRRRRHRRSRRTRLHDGPSADEIQRIVSSGRNLMPAFGGFLDEAAIANVSAWVRELARRAEEKQRN